MSDHNREPGENQDQNQNENQNQNQNQGGGGNKNALLGYTFLPYKDGAGFQITNQHPAVTKFLEQQPMRLFTASNGYRIGLGVLYPEWKLSDNVVYLDGTNGKRLKKVDVTRFPIDGRVYRDGQMALVRTALAELVATVKETFEEVLRLKPERRSGRVVLA